MLSKLIGGGGGGDDMASEMVKAATSDKLQEMDWARSIQICELVARDPGKAKDVIKAIKKCIGSRNKNTQLYAVMSAGVQFSNRPNIVVTRAEVPLPETRTEPDKGTSSTKLNDGQQEVPTQLAADTSIMRKASSVMEVLRDVLNSMDPRHHPEGATDEFVLDLAEQCTFQKQRIMHLVMTSRDELMVSQAIELNEELQKVLARHDALLSVHPTTAVAVDLKEEEEEDEDAESLYRRLRKGKALSRDYADHSVRSSRSMAEDKTRHPLTIQPPQPDKRLGTLNVRSPDSVLRPDTAPLVPPPPSKHAERERFFREKSMDGVTSLPGHLRGLSLHSRDRDGSSSCSGGTGSVSGD